MNLRTNSQDKEIYSLMFIVDKEIKEMKKKDMEVDC